MSLKRLEMHAPKPIEDMTEQELSIAAYAYELGYDNSSAQEWANTPAEHGDILDGYPNTCPNPYLGEHWISYNSYRE